MIHSCMSRLEDDAASVSLFPEGRGQGNVFLQCYRRGGREEIAMDPRFVSWDVPKLSNVEVLRETHFFAVWPQ